MPRKTEPGRASRRPAEMTIKDISQMAGVSVATVSRVINETGLVTPVKRKAVEDVLARVRYIPNNAARSLVKRRTMTVGTIVPTLTNPIFAPTIAAIEETLAEAGYGLLVSCSHRDPQKEFSQACMMMERGVEGIVLTGSYRHPDLLPLMASRDVVAVSQDDPVGAPDLVSLAMPDAPAMGAAIDALVAAGHGRIGIVTGPTQSTRPIANRLRGARDRLIAHGLDAGSDGISETADYSAKETRAATRTLLGRCPDLTAIACTGDILALGVIAECRQAGYEVPRTMSVIGCGETVMSQYTDPILTTIRLEFELMGRLAATRILDQIEARQFLPQVSLGYELVAGGTVAPPYA